VFPPVARQLFAGEMQRYARNVAICTEEGYQGQRRLDAVYCDAMLRSCSWISADACGHPLKRIDVLFCVRGDAGDLRLGLGG
jgi:hypothetical protein